MGDLTNVVISAIVGLRSPFEWITKYELKYLILVVLLIISNVHIPLHNAVLILEIMFGSECWIW